MKYALKEGIGGCTIIKCTADLQAELPEKAFKIFELLPKNMQQTLIVTAKPCFHTSNFCAAVQQAKLSKLISIGGSTPPEYIGITEHKHYQSAQDFLNAFCEEDFQQENILYYEAAELEQLPYLLDDKCRQTILDVSLDAVAHNIRYFQSKLKQGTKLMALVKAFSYGSGAYEVACLMQQLGVDYLGVAATDEGVALRQCGINMPIVVLTPETAGLERMIKYGLEPEIHNLRSLNAFKDAAKRMDVEGYPIHVKIDTGMHRQGFEAKELQMLIDILCSCSSLKVASAFTHLAASDEEKYDSFTRQQLTLFDKLSVQLQDGLGYSFIRHALNSAGAERFPEGQFDMARLGIGMYGASDVSVGGTKVISSFRSVITQVKDIPLGETVGYGRRGDVKRPTRIAVIPVGYADGLNRRLGNGRSRFVVNGHSVPTIGNVCMDLTMIDITGLNIKEGDVVTIFGEDPSVFELANKLDTISYEILTSVAARVKRIYHLSEDVLG